MGSGLYVAKKGDKARDKTHPVPFFANGNVAPNA